METLMKVDVIREIILAKLAESRLLFKKDIENYFKNAINVIPIPLKNSVEYFFKLSRSTGIDEGLWIATILDKKVHIPWESLLPLELLEQITSYPVDSSETVQLFNIRYRGNRYNLSFIHYLDDAVVGIIQKLTEPMRIEEESVPALDISQFLELPEDRQVKIFLTYFHSSPEIRKKCLFDFFVNILPGSQELKNVI